MKSASETIEIFDKLDEQHPGADTELHHRNAFELLVATILSAQSTDQRVNLVTPALFEKYPDAQSLARAKTNSLQKQIRTTGFFRAKSQSLLGMARTLVEKHNGEVPASMDLLVELPGVGRKTANVVLGHALGVPGLPVDRHVLRVANRIGVAESDKPEVVEQQLTHLLPPDRWTRASDALILHGRRICRPKPLCDRCLVQEHCDYFQHVISKTQGSSPSGSKGPSVVVAKKERRKPDTAVARGVAPPRGSVKFRKAAKPGSRRTASARTRR